MRFMRVQLASVAVLFMTMVGCGTSPQVRFYMLSSDSAQVGRDTGQATTNPTIGLRPVVLPYAVDRPQFVLRTGINRVNIVDDHRWVGSLRDEVQRVIAENLSQAINGKRVYSYPYALSDTADISVFVTIQRFESVLGKTATIDALWTVRWGSNNSKSGRVIAEERVSGMDYEELAAAHSRALMTISGKITSAIQSVGSTSDNSALLPPSSLP